MGRLLEGEFKSLDEKLFKIEIDCDFYTGGAQILNRFGVNPIIVDWKDTKDPIRGSEASVSILNSELTDIRDEFLLIEVPNSILRLYEFRGLAFELVWEGYVTPYNYDYLYGEDSDINFTALDKLSSLKNIDVTIAEGNYTIQEIIENVVTPLNIANIDYSGVQDTFIINGETKNLLQLLLIIIPNTFKSNYELLHEALRTINARAYQFEDTLIIYREAEIVDSANENILPTISIGAGESLSPSIRKLPLTLSSVDNSSILFSKDVNVNFFSNEPFVSTEIYTNEYSKLTGLSNLFSRDVLGIGKQNDYMPEYMTYPQYTFPAFAKSDFSTDGIWKKPSIVNQGYVLYEREVIVNFSEETHIGDKFVPNPNDYESINIKIKGSAFSNKVQKQSFYQSTDEAIITINLPPLVDLELDGYRSFDTPLESHMGLQIIYTDSNNNKFVYCRYFKPEFTNENGEIVAQQEIFFWEPKLDAGLTDRIQRPANMVETNPDQYLRFLDLGLSSGTGWNYSNEEFSADIPIKGSGKYEFFFFGIETSIIEDEMSKDWDTLFKKQWGKFHYGLFLGSEYLFGIKDWEIDEYNYDSLFTILNYDIFDDLSIFNIDFNTLPNYDPNGWQVIANLETKYGPSISVASLEFAINSGNTAISNKKLIGVNTSKNSGDTAEQFDIRFSSYPGLSYGATVLGRDSVGNIGNVNMPSGNSLLLDIVSEIMKSRAINSRKLDATVFDNDIVNTTPRIDHIYNYDSQKWVIKKLTRDYRLSQSSIILQNYSIIENDVIEIQPDTYVDPDSEVTGNSSFSSPSSSSSSSSSTSTTTQISKTSQLINDGSDGDSRYVELDEIGLVVDSDTKLYFGRVIWISGLTFYVWASKYKINGILREEFISATITLDPADLTDPRVDTFIIRDNGLNPDSIIVIKGTASPNPFDPAIDLDYQLKISNVYVEANSTEPTGSIREDVYIDGSEWDITSTANVEPLQTTYLIGGTSTIKFNNAVLNDSITLSTQLLTLKTLPSTSIVFDINLNGSWDINSISLDIYLLLDGNVVSGRVRVGRDTNIYIFIQNSFNVQKISVPLELIPDYNSSIEFNGIMFKFSTDTPKTFYIDNIFISGVLNTNSGNPLFVVRGDGTVTPISKEEIDNLEIDALTVDGRSLSLAGNVGNTIPYRGTNGELYTTGIVINGASTEELFVLRANGDVNLITKSEIDNLSINAGSLSGRILDYEANPDRIAVRGLTDGSLKAQLFKLANWDIKQINGTLVFSSAVLGIDIQFQTQIGGSVAYLNDIPDSYSKTETDSKYLLNTTDELIGNFLVTGIITANGGIISNGGISIKQTGLYLESETTSNIGNSWMAWKKIVSSVGSQKGFFGYASISDNDIYLTNQESGGQIRLGTGGRYADILIASNGDVTFANGINADKLSGRNLDFAPSPNTVAGRDPDGFLSAVQFNLNNWDLKQFNAVLVFSNAVLGIQAQFQTLKGGTVAYLSDVPDTTNFVDKTSTETIEGGKTFLDFIQLDTLRYNRVNEVSAPTGSSTIPIIQGGSEVMIKVPLTLFKDYFYSNTNWASLPLEGTNVASGSIEYKIKNDMLLLKGTILANINTSNLHLGTLPVGFRPERIRYSTVVNFSGESGSSADPLTNLWISTNGEVRMNSFSFSNWILDVQILLDTSN